MPYKRNRSEFEQSPNQSPSFALYGTALPPLDSSTRDDGSYVPAWKQEVVDERGRKRLHGAFTGGFSAGLYPLRESAMHSYFNTVGSKEGWTPSAFKSSRGARAKTGLPKPEDFMDEEDLREAEEARQIEMNRNFVGIGGPEDGRQPRTLMDLLIPAIEDTMGTKLLKKMGWKEGQGIGPKTLRKAKDFDGETEGSSGSKEFLFAPENARLVSFRRKDDVHGLGYAVEAPFGKSGKQDEGNTDVIGFGTGSKPAKLKKPTGPAFGVGILNDDGEDDEDPYEIRPKSSYNRVIGGDKPKKKPAARPLAGKHVFVPKKAATLKSYETARKCHDGRLPLPGFILADVTVEPQKPHYPPPTVPEDWKIPGMAEKTPAPKAVSTGDASVAKLDPRARGALLGEAPLPGKSVFDFLTPEARNRIANLTGKTDLPQGLGEAPPSTTRSTIADIVPQLDSSVALSALKGGYMPYGDDLEKRARYRSFLEIKAGLREGLPDRKYGMNTQDWVKEMTEFVGAARIFKPLSGSMATRFTSSASTNIQGNMDKSFDSDVLINRPAAKEEDPAEAAARMSMYGPLTRSVIEWTPNRLLCKRFNVQYMGPNTATAEIKSAAAANFGVPDIGSGGVEVPIAETSKPDVLQIDAEKNEALEGERAADEVFKNIFGDSDDDEDE
ncbi:hypothetical protein FN846DRAFT_777246 [Sphaerosporella brunnea]|uniref:G-patch domain-containing protein n=1 Tax=Sphaerosporella brunnea TaxID=1250544 RepID=A0A5J5EZU3_9PEZI|nr:hypothetical protein FN846DRAFT_777246 [Sphaerosporella brunnea]